MAKIFLSYSRSDLERIEPLAKALEKEGHSVWWDRRIKGGSEFESVIEKALADADWVVVAWSQTASRSAWVRDEAAAGRDRHCLIPLTLDGSVPPLGFRQIQTIDLSRWRGRGRPPQLDELIESLAAPTFEETPQKQSVEPGGRRKWLAFPRLPAIAAFAALVVALIGFGWWWGIRGPADAPLVSVEAGNAAEKSQEVARVLAAQLGDLQPAGGGAFQLTSSNSNADFVLKINAADEPEKLRRDLSLVSSGSILWSTTWVYEGDYPDDLAQDLPRISGQVLSCAVQARRVPIEPATLKLYVRGCAQLEDYMGLGNYDTPAVKLFEEVVRKAPDFEAGWAKLLRATPAAGDLKTLIAQTEKLGLHPGELYVAKARLLPPQDFLGKLSLIERGIEADRDNARLYARHALMLAGVGRMKEAIAEAARSLQLDPVSLDSQQTYTTVLENGGEIDQLHQQLSRRQAKWPRASLNQSEFYHFYANFGDPERALAMYRDGVIVFPDLEQEDFIVARMNPTPTTIQRAIESARSRHARDPTYAATLLQLLGQFGRTDEAIILMVHYAGPDTIINSRLFHPAMRNVWRDPRSMAAAAHLGLLRYWKSSGHWPDFCHEPDLPYDCKKEAAKIDANAFVRLRPAPLSAPDFSATRPTAKCRDGNFSFSQSRDGTCGLHGGVTEWLSTDMPT